MKVRVGTSGFSYKEWKGSFYPADLPASRMLEYYAERLPTVEINNTFYRMPKAEMLNKWAAGTSPDFRFVLKAPQRITHRERLRDSGASLSFFFDAARALGSKLGPVLFQLPPFFKKDVPLLESFLTLLPEDRPAAFEFRHPTWFSEDVYAALRGRGAALCCGDVDDASKSPPFVTTANWGYLRLRRTEYGAGEIEAWADRIRSQEWEHAYVFFKHEEQGPELAHRLLTLCA